MATPSRKALRNALVQVVCDLAEERDWTDELHKRLMDAEQAPALDEQQEQEAKDELAEWKDMADTICAATECPGKTPQDIAYYVTALHTRWQNEKCRTRRQGEELERLKEAAAEPGKADARYVAQVIERPGAKGWCVWDTRWEQVAREFLIGQFHATDEDAKEWAETAARTMNEGGSNDE